jgi:hypothetical protein
VSAFALDPLIAEAKRRAHLRRLFLAALGITVAAAAVTAVVRDSERTSPAALTAPACRPAQLRLLPPSFDGAYTGHVVTNLGFRNTSANACSIGGWPRFEVVLPDGRTVVASVGHVRNVPSGHGRAPTGAVVLHAGGAASFHVVADDGTGLERCGLPLPSVRTLVVPPGASTPAHGSTTMPYCHDPQRLLAFLTPVVAGPYDRYSPG